jgi:hypothetical protein
MKTQRNIAGRDERLTRQNRIGKAGVRRMLQKIDHLLAKRIWIVGVLIIALPILGDWLFYGDRPLCGWEGVFGHISWCPKPTALEQRIARERAIEREQKILLSRRSSV